MTLTNKLGYIGVDECGTGALAGPILVCATYCDIMSGNPRVRDSKKIQRNELIRLAAELMASEQVTYSCVLASAATINNYGPKDAWCYAVREAVFRLRMKCGIIKPVLIDGNIVPEGLFNATCVVKGDSKWFQIAAAAIIAKSFRLRYMKALARRYPAYGFHTSDGYGTREHENALRTHGPTPEHRDKATRTLLANSNRKAVYKRLYG